MLSFQTTKNAVFNKQWKFQDAENNFGKLVQNALTKGPQCVTHEGFNAVVIISVKDYEHLVSEKSEFRDFLLNCPKTDINFERERQKDFSRDIQL